MNALLQQQPSSGVRTMQTINSLIQNPSFFALFFGTTVAMIGILLLAVHRLAYLGSILPLLGSLLFLVGTFGVTILFNVPLNKALAGHDSHSAEATQLWPVYVSKWLRWNHVRTATSFAAAALLTLSPTG